MSKKTGILLIQLGSPQSPAPEDVKVFLKKFLSDPRVVDSQGLAWKLILNLFVLPVRSKKSAEAYQKIWDGKAFPQEIYTEAFSQKLKDINHDENLRIEHSYILNNPSVKEKLCAFSNEGIKKIRVIPLFPQFAEATTLSCQDAVEKAMKSENLDFEIDYVDSFCRAEAFVKNMAAKIDAEVKDYAPDRLLLSFHGYPIRRILAGDKYFDECADSAKLLSTNIHNIEQEKILMTFQSRFGSEPWLEPSTQEIIAELAKDGVKKIAVACPSFTVDNLETLEEIGMTLKEDFLKNGGEDLKVIPALNDDDEWVADFANGILSEVTEATVPEDSAIKIPEVKLPETALQPEAKNSIKIVFTTLFLDLIGFSIIFPLFPAMLEYYVANDSTSSVLKFFLDTVDSISNVAGSASDATKIVLFGGILSFLYSFLQFLMSPITGALSDRFGRRPILIVSVSGIAFSYLLWAFSGNFTLLVVSRIIAGIMGSNITTATAVIADVTNEKNRSKGMAFIGIAFGVGFLIGPALGGLSALLDLTKYFPNSTGLGLNPFSMPALIAFVLSVYNLYFIVTKFQESLSPENRGKSKSLRTINPLTLFKISEFPGAGKVIWSNFIFLSAFSGAEFTLTFLAAERLHYKPVDNGLMFIYIGLILAFVQGGYVRRKVAIIGEKRMCMQGYITIIPGLIITGIAYNSFVLYFGLFFMAVGSAQIIPCLTGLVSLHSPAHSQGRALGVFRSAGALARTIGPLVACIVYWRLGSTYPYYLSGAAIGIPLILVFFMKKDSVSQE